MRRMVNERIGGSHAGEAASERVPRLGVALLEVIVALAIFATAGVAALAMAAEITRVVRDAHAAEAELRDASAFLEAVVLWPRSDLDQRLGDRRQGPWLLRVERPHRRSTSSR